MASALNNANAQPDELSCIGITNQRETVLIWDKSTGEPVANAIVWQDRRTTEACETLKSTGVEGIVKERTGLLLDPYFSGSKIAWLLDTHQLHQRARRGENDVQYYRYILGVAFDRSQRICDRCVQCE